jgi:hypothetical protein
LDKIFTQNEQLLIATAENPDIMVWNLWSRKEAYKSTIEQQEAWLLSVEFSMCL